MRKYIVAAVLLVAVLTAAIASDITTRFGPLKIGGEFGTALSYKGHRLIHGHNELSLVRRFRVGRTDVLLIQETGGTACPALYYFVSVSASGAKATRAFGTCDELIKVTQKGRAIQVTMPGFRGPLEPEGDREKAARERHMFLFRAGIVTEKGTPARRSP